MKRSQSAIEYLLALGITIIVVFLVVGYVARYTHSEASTAANTVEKGGETIKEGVKNITEKELNE
ncbi:hypothetical protein PFDSM3638_02530 [Pyrococcus furiosus DSM 3638]|uniref:Class III signal peptide-containing protein n=2 Tax=Pyrococcus furiosus TaxID=2261 RepID=A0A5C0XTY3_PYRFU|nr:hypothetical protein [Pyrococcus furiosus]AFN03302.1 hypothetical protein PFC_01655 [Pyrococcus furiosus COM1]QEK78220.1 hypothetical protein PFDSM3638_02530 [Pyrococcus furiosus DSM 3638]